MACRSDHRRSPQTTIFISSSRGKKGDSYPALPLASLSRQVGRLYSLSLRWIKRKKVTFFAPFWDLGSRREAGMALPSRHPLVCHLCHTVTGAARRQPWGGFLPFARTPAPTRRLPPTSTGP